MSRMFDASSRFRTKFILVAGIGVFVGLVASAGVALYGVSLLGQESTEQVEEGMGSAAREYLTNHLIDSALQIYEILGRASSDLEIMASITQGMIDRADELEPMHDLVSGLPSLEDRLVYNPEGNWFANGPKEPMYVGVWGYLLDRVGADAPPTIKPEVRAHIASTSILDLIIPPFQERGSSNLQVYFVGPENAPYLRIAPWAPAASQADKKYPGHNEKPFWDFYFPALVKSWMQWSEAEGGPDARPRQVTILPPYEDAGGGGLVTTFLRPVWSADRKTFAGAMGIDLTLKQLVDFIKDLRIYDSGFAFLVQSSGNVLAVNDTGERTLGLTLDKKSGAAGGVDMLRRKLGESTFPAIAGLELPTDDLMVYRELEIDGKPYVLALRRLQPLDAWIPGQVGIVPEHWSLGMMVPATEIFGSLQDARAAIDERTQDIVSSQIAITVATMLMVLLGISIVSRRMTSDLEGLTAAARRMMAKDYAVSVEVKTTDEVGELGAAFNAMAEEIRAHTENLEGLVRQRTRQLEEANAEISSLNEMLKEENLRLGAELEVARRLQLMVLPNERELSEIKGLDIAGFMEPADEVGGDYYDVLRAKSGLKIGIGDVTGHGLESGVLMILLQTAVRTLVLAEERDPERFLSIINKAVYQNIQRIDMDRSVTLSLIDYDEGMLELTGQHEEAIIVRADGTLERIDTMELGLPVGIEFDIAEFLGKTRVELAPGDVVVLYTDGITEAENAAGEQYGLDRLCEIVRRNYAATASEVKDAALADVNAFIGDQKVFDDITLVVIKRTVEEAAA